MVTIPADGLSFLRALQYALGMVYNEKYSIGTIMAKIIEEVKKRPNFYQQFILDCTEPHDVIKELQTFFDTHFFLTDIFELLITVFVNVFRIMIWIFQEDENSMCKTTKFCTDNQESKRHHVHMMLFANRNDTRGLGNHYNTILKKRINNGRTYIDFGQEVQETGLSETYASNLRIMSPDESSSSTGPSTPGNINTPNNSGSESEDDDISQQDFSNEADCSMYNLHSEEDRVVFPEEIFSDVDPEIVRCVPYNINGNHSYRIDVTENKWHKHQDDGRWFLMHTSTMHRK